MFLICIHLVRYCDAGPGLGDGQAFPSCSPDEACGGGTLLWLRVEKRVLTIRLFLFARVLFAFDFQCLLFVDCKRTSCISCSPTCVDCDEVNGEIREVICRPTCQIQ